MALFEVLGVPRLWSTLVYTISVGTAQKFAKHNWDYGIRSFSVIDKLVRYCICFQHRVFFLPWWYFPIQLERFTQPEKLCTVQRVEGIIFSWYSRGLSVIEKNPNKVDFANEEFLHREINKNGVYMWITVRYRQPESSITEIWQYWTKVGD